MSSWWSEKLLSKWRKSEKKNILRKAIFKSYPCWRILTGTGELGMLTNQEMKNQTEFKNLTGRQGRFQDFVQRSIVFRGFTNKTLQNTSTICLYAFLLPFLRVGPKVREGGWNTVIPPPNTVLLEGLSSKMKATKNTIIP